MKIEHAALYAADLEACRDFFVRYFGGTAGSCYHNATTGFRSYFITFDDGARLEVMTRPGLAGAEPATSRQAYRAGYAHLAFSVGSRQNVDALTATLKADGFAITSGPRTTGDGYYESSVLGIEGIPIEITI